MIFQAVGNRCAVDLSSVDIPLARAEILARLNSLGFKTLNVDIVQIIEGAVGASVYKRGARMHLAPHEMDCSGFVKWVYAQRGIHIPRRAVHQKAMTIQLHDDDLRPGDLVFMSGAICPPIGNPKMRVGHVGIISEGETVLHATPEASDGIARDTLTSWRQSVSWRGAGRILEQPESTITLEIPPSMDIESSDDVTWMLLETLDW